MQHSTIQRLLPRGATLTSGALTCLTAVAGTSMYIIKTLNHTTYETNSRLQHAPERALYTGRDAALADGRSPQHSQHSAEVPHHSPAEPLPALSGTHATTLRPAHPSHLGLPLPPGEPTRWRCRNLAAHEGRSRRHHRPP